MDLFENNRRWAQSILDEDPDFFQRLSKQQAPKYLWIGCADSRVPANEIVGLLPGELFVHRNVANLVVQTDLNCLSVLQFAVDVLKVEHIIVCGHYGCGGVRAAVTKQKLGLIDNWLRQIQDLAQYHRDILESVDTDGERTDVMCELNVIEQVVHVGETTVVQDAWDRGQKLSIHGWIYGICNGLLQDMGFSANSSETLAQHYERAVAQVRDRIND